MTADTKKNNTENTAATRTKRILFVLQRAPYGNYATRETLDAALAAAAFEQEVQLLFCDDGVWNLLPTQNSSAIHEKNIEKMLQALTYYDINSVFVDANSLQQRQLSAAQLNISVKLVDEQSLPALYQHADCVIAL